MCKFSEVPFSVLVLIKGLSTDSVKFRDLRDICVLYLFLTIKVSLYKHTYACTHYLPACFTLYNVMSLYFQSLQFYVSLCVSNFICLYSYYSCRFLTPSSLI